MTIILYVEAIYKCFVAAGIELSLIAFADFTKFISFGIFRKGSFHPLNRDACTKDSSDKTSPSLFNYLLDKIFSQ